jgi:hypothetical protein
MILKKLLSFCVCSLWVCPALAQEPAHTGMLLGPLGLNTVPSARMDKAGTLRLGVSTLDPYAHAFLGAQLSDFLYVQMRQTMDASDLNKSDQFFPGVDLKFQLLEENRVRPEVSVGLQSALGHKRMAGEYLVASKRYHNFDFTAGLGWGRYAGRWKLPNVLGQALSHFDKDRALDGEMPNAPENWFTGEDMGVFGGVEYFTPVDGLSVKFDLGADRYSAEKAAFSYDAPPPWAIGLSYKPTDWLDMNIAAHGTDKIMARVSLSPSIKKWNGAEKDSKVFLKKNRSMPSPGSNKAPLYDKDQNGNRAVGSLALDPFWPSPAQYREAMIEMANHTSPGVEEIEITPTVMRLRGSSVKLMRKDFENALNKQQGSLEEIWRNAAFNDKGQSGFVRHKEPWFGWRGLRLMLDQQISLSEEDRGILTRTSVVAGSRMATMFGFMDGGYALRINAYNNLDKLREERITQLLPVRSDVNDFTDNIVAVDELYTAFTHSLTPELHLVAAAGYLEEMFAGAGGEILYRPFGPRYAFGAELWQTFKRDPDTFMNLKFNGDHILSGHLNAWYDIPEADLTLHLKAGRYLGSDWGGGIGLKKTFRNGATLSGEFAVTNLADLDTFGDETHAKAGMRLTMPLGGTKYIPGGVHVRIKAEPFGRDSAEALESPVSLYELIEPFSYGHIVRNWADILPKAAQQKK